MEDSGTGPRVCVRVDEGLGGGGPECSRGMKSEEWKRERRECSGRRKRS